MTRASHVSTYDEDFFAWTQEQAAALRRLPQALVGDTLDVAHVAEEIEDLGKRDLREVSSYLARLFEHLMQIASSPSSRDVPHWSAEARLFQNEAVAAFSPSMRRVLDLAAVWTRMRKRIAANLDQIGIVLITPSDCPYSLEDLLVDDFDLDAARAKLAAAPRNTGA